MGRRRCAQSAVSRAVERASAPANALLAADAGPFSALSGQNVTPGRHDHHRRTQEHLERPCPSPRREPPARIPGRAPPTSIRDCPATNPRSAWRPSSADLTACGDPQILDVHSVSGNVTTRGTDEVAGVDQISDRRSVHSLHNIPRNYWPRRSNAWATAPNAAPGATTTCRPPTNSATVSSLSRSPPAAWPPRSPSSRSSTPSPSASTAQRADERLRVHRRMGPRPHRRRHRRGPRRFRRGRGGRRRHP